MSEVDYTNCWTDDGRLHTSVWHADDNVLTLQVCNSVNHGLHARDQSLTALQPKPLSSRVPANTSCSTKGLAEPKKFCAVKRQRESMMVPLRCVVCDSVTCHTLCNMRSRGSWRYKLDSMVAWLAAGKVATLTCWPGMSQTYHSKPSGQECASSSAG